MEDFDLDDDTMQEELESWLVTRLMFQRDKTDEQGWRWRYVYRPEGSRRTLVPLEHWIRWFGGRVIGSGDASSVFVATPELTYRRRQAHLNLLPLVRVGHPLFDGAVAYARQDDRGAAFSMWRHRPSYRGEEPLLAFRFDFLVDADPEYITGQIRRGGGESSHAIQRRLDALLPPRFVTIWLDEELEQLEEPVVLALLEEPYSNRLRVDGGRDWNLVGDLWAEADRRRPVADWRALVDRATAEAKRRVCEDLSLQEESTRARQSLETNAARVAAQLGARLERLAGPTLEVERAHLEQERMLFAAMDIALESPHIRLDSVGAIFLAGDALLDRSRL